MPKKIELTGKRFGRLVVTGFAGMDSRGEATWKCKCDCGGEKTTTGYLLRTMGTKSCGCIHAETMTRIKKKFNEYSEVDGHIEVKLMNCDEIMLCDIDDWETLKKHCWHKMSIGYAATNIKTNKANKVLVFHQIVIDAERGMQRDHINRNKLDNRKSNLRVVTPLDNVLNRGLNKNNKSGHKGVYFRERDNKWVAQIMSNRKCHPLGSFKNIGDAIAERAKAEKLYHGKASLNAGGVAV